MTLLEKIRNAPPEESALVVGFDPDINNAGYCFYQFKYNNVGMLRPIKVVMGTITPPPGTKRMAKAVSMSHEIKMNFQSFSDVLPAYALIEGQEIYHNDKDPLKTTVAKANDLMLLAYVSGAMIHRLQTLRAGIDIKLVKPKEWKGNAAKEAMHGDFLNHINKNSAEVYMDGKVWDRQLPNIHTLDACCMCLKSANKIAKGTWK